MLFSGMITITSSQDKKEEFKPNGKPLALIFTNFHTSTTGGETTPEFENTRAYLGYEYNFSKQWYAKVIFDVGNPGAGNHELAAFLKNAYFQYTSGKFTTYFGMISTTQFKVSEKIWGNRYMMKSYQDEYKFNSSADLGVNIDFDISDFLSIDFSVINGEGYKQIQGDEFLRPGFGFTIIPVKNITARVFVDKMGKDIQQQSLAAFLAYTNDKLVLAGEYNYQKNANMVNGADWFGPSIYTTFQTSDKVKFFARYDGLNSKELAGKSEAWNIAKDGSLLLGGVEYSPVKGVKLTPNIRYWNPGKEGAKNTTFLYFNCELKF